MEREFDFDVFLSHNSADKPRVRRVAERLRAAGLRVWFDEWLIAPGDDINLAIERGLETARTLVLFLSPAAMDSGWVESERSTALFRDPTNAERRFVPVFLEDCVLPDTLRRFRYVDLRTDSEDAFAELLAAVKGEPPPRSTAASKPTNRVRPRRSAEKDAAEPNVLPFALLSLGSFLAALVLLWLLIAKAEMLVGLGLEGQLYYVVLVPLGLSVAAFLFGALRSYALYRGEILGGMLELGGPVVVFCLVVLGGFLLVPSPEPFAVTVFVQGADGAQDVPLRGVGEVVLDLGPDRRRQPIGAEGEVHFTGIPARFRGQEVAIWVEADGYAMADRDGKHRLSANDHVTLAVERQPVILRGRVQDSELRPVEGARLLLGELETASDAEGAFVLEIPGKMLDEKLILDVSAFGYEPKSYPVVPNSNDVNAMLRRSTSTE